MVDDTKTFAESLSASIRTLGYEVTYTTSVQEAQSMVRDPRYQLLLLDYNIHGFNGLELARLAREQNPDVHLVLLSGEAGPHICRLQLRVPGLICWRKPLRIQQFDELLAAVTTGACPLCEHLPEAEVASDGLSLLLSNSTPTLAKLEDLCGSELRRAINNTKAEAGVVCGIEEGSFKIRVLAQRDPAGLLRRYDLQQLKHSPVWDIIEREETMRVRDVDKRPTRFRHLAPWGTFRAFLGVPVRGQSNDTRLGILLFHREENHFSAYHEQQALLSAGHLGLTLERQNVLRTTLSVQQAIITGRIHLALAHEVQKQAGTLQSQMDRLMSRVTALRGRGAPNYATLQEVELPRMAVDLQRTVDELGMILERQLDFSRPYDILTFNLNTLVKQTLEILRPMAQDSTLAIRLKAKLDPEMPPLKSAENLVKQIILNLTLNAIEQMKESGTVNGELRITTQYVPDDVLPVRVLFSDCGPGIHMAHQKRLFQQGFTTRSGGTGLGLYISRSAAEALGGRLVLRESYVGYGSTFALELPESHRKVDHERPQ
ncbi:MAG: ATP-binding protein [Chloroflexota bacterium]|nr:ATP-binding protein [Chloroflexota bacterium]